MPFAFSVPFSKRVLAMEINAEPRDSRRKTVNARVNKRQADAIPRAAASERDNDASFNALANNRPFGEHAALVPYNVTLRGGGACPAAG